MVDVDAESGDWIKMGAWDMPDTWEQFYDHFRFLAWPELPDRLLKEVENWPSMPSMPPLLHAQWRAFLDAPEGKERDALRPPVG